MAEACAQIRAGRDTLDRLRRHENGNNSTDGQQDGNEDRQCRQSVPAGSALNLHDGGQQQGDQSADNRETLAECGNAGAAFIAAGQLCAPSLIRH